MNRSKLSLLPLLTLLGLGSAQAADRSGTYRFQYPTAADETPREDHYIVLTHVQDGYAGRYHGTSDDFDPGREGYSAGYFAVDMDSLSVTDDSIHFVLHLEDAQVVKRPLLPALSGNSMARPRGNGPWGMRLDSHRRAYKGVFRNGLLFVDDPLGARTFAPQAPAAR